MMTEAQALKNKVCQLKLEILDREKGNQCSAIFIDGIFVRGTPEHIRLLKNQMHEAKYILSKIGEEYKESEMEDK